MAYPVMSTSVPWSLVRNGFHKTPHFNNVRQRTAARRGSVSYALMSYPTWDFEVDLNFVLGGPQIQGSAMSEFLGCYMATLGGGGFFIFEDPSDRVVSISQGVLLNVTPGAHSPMGQNGDGNSTKFQAARMVGQGADIVQIVSLVQLCINSQPTSGYSISDKGVVTFNVAPAAGATLTWSGSFAYLCQFTDDTLKDLALVSKNIQGWIWSCSAIGFESIHLSDGMAGGTPPGGQGGGSGPVLVNGIQVASDPSNMFVNGTPISSGDGVTIDGQ